MLRNFIILAVMALLAFAGWRFWSVENSYATLQKAPQGQAAGPEGASLVVVELMDYRCPACRMVAPVIRDVIAAHPDVRFVFRHLPIFREPSVREARLALAAGKQGKFMEMHEALMNRSAPVTDEDIPALAAALELDAAKLQQEMKGEDITKELLATVSAAETLKINATPTFMIGKTLYSFNGGLPTTEDFSRVIAAARTAKK